MTAEPERIEEKPDDENPDLEARPSEPQVDENGEPIPTDGGEGGANLDQTTMTQAPGGKKNKYYQFSIEELKNFLAQNKDEIAPGKYRRIV